MSTSISLTMSPAELQEGSNNIVDPPRAKYTAVGGENLAFQHVKPFGLDKLSAEPYGTSPSKTTPGQPLYGRQRHTTDLSAGAAKPTAQFVPRDATSKLKRWPHHAHKPQTTTTPESQKSLSQEHLTDFYAEVDDRMSRNSAEYPMQQARYIDRWLDDAAGRTPASGVRNTKSFEENEREFDVGPNVIGIRGFSSESFIAESKRCREDHALLKQDYLRLQVDYRKLRARLQEYQRRREEKSQPPPSLPPGDLEASLRALVIKQARRLEEMTQSTRGRNGCDRCQGCNHMSNQNHIANSGAVSEALALVGELRLEGEHLRRAIDERDGEVRHLREQVAHLQLEPGNRKLIELTSENARLRSARDTGRVELEALEGEYLQLEARLKLLMEGQKSLGQEQGDEMNRVLLELCQFQVSQPKLEMLLETERQIKIQLQEKITSLLEERERQQEEINGLARDLNDAKLRTRAHETNELEKLRSELDGCRSKCARLEGERASLEELLRASKAKVVQLDARLSGEVQQVREQHQCELAEARASARRCESETGELRAELQRLAERFAQCDSERRQANDRELELHRQLELAQSAIPSERARGDSARGRLEASERELASCQEELASCAANNRELKSKLELTESQLERIQRQHAELKRRFEVQQKVLDGTISGKDRELARLRVDLNFERYNRQVSVRGIEKELRASLRELETMKCRFSRRLCNGPAVATSGACEQEQGVTKSARGATADGGGGGGGGGSDSVQ